MFKELASVYQHLIDKVRIFIETQQKSCNNSNNAKWAYGTETADEAVEVVEGVEEGLLRRQDKQRRQ